ncbi:MAG: hypothetical protein WBC44_08845 [Planctomycetaceae bacterium]
MPEFNQEKSFEQYLAEWPFHSGYLADWALRHLLNRTDAYVRYLPMSRRTDGRKMWTVKDKVPRKRVCWHFSGADVGNLVAFHATSAVGTCRWIGIDLDCHDDNPDLAMRNWNFGVAISNRLLSIGITPLVMDSDGRGGIHVLVLFTEPVDSQMAYRFAKWLVRDWQSYGISEPETFPKQPTLKGLQFGSALRLPGRHHTRSHWTRVLTPGGLVSGGDAARLILATPLHPPRMILAEARNYQLPAEFPPQFVMLLPEHIARSQSSPKATLAKEEILGRARTYLEKSGPATEGQGGDNHFWRLIWCIRTKFSLTIEEAYALFLEWNAGCLPPFSPEYVWKQLLRVWSRPA